MDNFTHSLAGWALGQAGLKTKTRKGLAALILGANMPDLDVVLPLFGYQGISTHRGFTHGVGGMMIQPFVLAGLLWLLDRWQVSRGQTFRSGLPMHFGWLLGLSLIGLLTHPLLDFQNTYGVQLLAPFGDVWYAGDTLFIIDVWVWTALTLGLWFSRRRERQGGEWRRPMQAVIAGATVYIAANCALSLHAEALTREAVQRERGMQTDLVIAGEVPALFWKREMIWRSNGLVGTGDYDLFAGFSRVTLEEGAMPDLMDRPVIARAAAASPEIAAFLYWSQVPMARIESAPGGQVKVSVGDARFAGIPGRSQFNRSVVVPADPASGR